MTSKLQKAISTVLCIFMVIGVLPNDLFVNQTKVGYAEAPLVAESEATEAPTEEPTNTPEPEVTPEPTQEPIVEPSYTDAPTCAPEDTQPQVTPPALETIAPLPEHPYLRFEMQPGRNLLAVQDG